MDWEEAKDFVKGSGEAALLVLGFFPEIEEYFEPDFLFLVPGGTSSPLGFGANR